MARLACAAHAEGAERQLKQTSRGQRAADGTLDVAFRLLKRSNPSKAEVDALHSLLQRIEVAPRAASP